MRAPRIVTPGVSRGPLFGSGFRDGALHEVAEFKDQLLDADPKARASWWKAGSPAVQEPRYLTEQP